MSPWGWAAVLVLGGGLIWLAFAMIGLVREVAALRAELDALAVVPVELAGGLAVGSLGPAWTIETTAGPIDAVAFSGRRHLLVFADADCRACDELVPAVVRAAGDMRLPPTVVIGPDGTDVPSAWSGPNVTAGSERAREVSGAYGIDVTPHVFVIDEQGAIVAQGDASGLADVESLVNAAEGIRIVPGANHG